MQVQNEVKKGVAPIVVLLAVLIISGMDAAECIENPLIDATIGAAAMVELYLFLYMINVV